MEYTVIIEFGGKMTAIGSINNGCFSYKQTYLDNPDSRPISISLPLRDTPYSPDETKRYFDGLLPEGFSRRCVADYMHVSEDDYLSILAGLGKECIGAIQITDDNTPLAAEYRKLSLSEVKELAAEGATKSAKIVTESHLSLTGASGKVGLYYDADNHEWYQPIGTAPSTHIIKQSHVRLNGIVVNELLCQSTARKCGISVPESFIINTGKANDADILFATKRYDREFGNTVMIDGLPTPKRLHQEDFAQAMGIASANKYEQSGSKYLKVMFDILKNYSSNPLEDRIKLWDMLMFNLLIGNTDSHLKNFSLIYNSNLISIRLAPAYDMVSTTAYETGTRRLSLRIGKAEYLDDVTEKELASAAREAGIGEKLALSRYHSMRSAFESNLRESAKELCDKGYPQAKEISNRILSSGLYSKL